MTFLRALKLLFRSTLDVAIWTSWDLLRKLFGMGRVYEPPETETRSIIELTVKRPFRDAIFTKQIQLAYDKRCAMTGLRIINGGGRAEAQAAHIRPVSREGPDSPRNGLALSSTVHWVFDRGLLSIDDDFRILKAKGAVPEEVSRLLNPSGQLIVPQDYRLQPHKQFLRFHREAIFKG